MGSLWNRSGLIERHADDLRAAGAKAYFFNGGTTTPLTVFQDSGEAAAHPHPVVADAYGRWPDVFVPYIVSYDVQVKTAEGEQLTYTLRIPNPDPVDLTVTAEATSTVQTGMIHPELINTVKAGYVRLNGRTLGNGSSSATERANADTEALFSYLWANLDDAIAAVSGGRGISAAADYAANKTIVLPSCQGALLMGLDDMGASAAGAFGSLSFNTGDELTPGSSIGVNGIALATGNLPAHSHTGSTSADTVSGTTGSESASHTHTGIVDSGGAHSHTITITDPGHTHSYLTAGPNRINSTGAGEFINQTGATTGSSTTDITASSDTTGAHTHTFTSGTPSAQHTHNFTSASHSHTFTTDAQGSSTPFNNLGLTRLVTWYIKL